MSPRDRLKPGGSCRAPEGATGSPFGDGVIVFEGIVHHRTSNLEHQMRTAWRLTHLLLGVHPAVQQPLNHTFRDRRRDWLLAPRGRRIIDDDVGRPAHICFEFAQKACNFQCNRGYRRGCCGFERRHGFSDEIETAPDLAMPEPPPDPLKRFAEAVDASGQLLAAWATCWIRIERWNQSNT